MIIIGLKIKCSPPPAIFFWKSPEGVGEYDINAKLFDKLFTFSYVFCGIFRLHFFFQKTEKCFVIWYISFLYFPCGYSEEIRMKLQWQFNKLFVKFLRQMTNIKSNANLALKQNKPNVATHHSSHLSADKRKKCMVVNQIGLTRI